jgi:hypothetical protein
VKPKVASKKAPAPKKTPQPKIHKAKAMATKSAEKKETHDEEPSAAPNNHAPAPETVDREAESKRLKDEDRERFEHQGDKG